eukprot:4348671-Amphidinium_carterae.1
MHWNMHLKAALLSLVLAGVGTDTPGIVNRSSCVCLQHQIQPFLDLLKNFETIWTPTSSASGKCPWSWCHNDSLSCILLVFMRRQLLVKHRAVSHTLMASKRP